MNDNGITDALVLLIEAASDYLNHTGDCVKRDRLRRMVKFAESHIPDPPLTVIPKHDFMERVRRATATDGMKQDANGNLYQRD